MEKINRKKYMIDASDQILGRLATQIAMILRGKNKANFSYRQDTGDAVEVINIEKIKVSGEKMQKKIYYRHSGWIGNLKSVTMEKLFAKNPAKILKLAIYGMLPKNKLRDKMMSRLIIKEGK